MDHFKVLKQALETTWRYRALWVFGILVALTTTSRGGGNGGRVPFSGDGDFRSLPGDFAFPEIGPRVISIISICTDFH